MSFPEYTINCNFENSILDYFSRGLFFLLGSEQGTFEIVSHLVPLTIALYSQTPVAGG